MLTRDQIEVADDLPCEAVEVPEWGGVVMVRGLTAAERDAFEAELVQVRGKTTVTNLVNVRAKLAVRCIVDERGKRLLSDADATWLGEKAATALNRVFETAQRLSGLSKEDVEELAGN